MADDLMTPKLVRYINDGGQIVKKVEKKTLV